MLTKLKKVNNRPKLYEVSKEKFWDDPYISKGMLKAHLNPDVESATRTKQFVEQSVDWITKVVPPKTHNKVLDLGCGPGIYAELFHQNGYQVTGIDLSKRSIDYAKLSAKEKKYSITYKVDNYVAMECNHQYDLITLIYCDFGVLSTTDRKILLKKIYTMLSPNGYFLFDVFTPQRYIGKSEYRNWNIEENGFWSQEDSLVLESFYRYEKENTFLQQYIVINSQKTSYYNIWEHTFTLEEIKKDLQEAGFKDISYYGDVAGTKLHKDSDTMCLVVRK